jgi:hypothetical protein
VFEDFSVVHADFDMKNILNPVFFEGQCNHATSGKISIYSHILIRITGQIEGLDAAAAGRISIFCGACPKHLEARCAMI